MSARTRPPTPGVQRPPRPLLGRLGHLATLALALLLPLLPNPLRAELQFDVFLGLDDHVREGHWFPVAFEILNDGPTLTGTVTVGPDGNLDAHRHTFVVELPTNTRKQITLPVFPANGRYSRWEARLQDPAGNILAERTDLAPRDVAAVIPLLGAIPRTFGGLPAFPEVQGRAPEFHPAVARLQPSLLPVHPIAYDALTAFYLSSEKASDLRADQADALLAWVHQGGHLIVAIDQPSDILGNPWLKATLPFHPETVATRPAAAAFERWLTSGPEAVRLPSSLRKPSPQAGQRPRNRSTARATNRTNPPDSTPANSPPLDPYAGIQPDPGFGEAAIPIITGKATGGTVILADADTPLIVSTPLGRGTLTALAFSPERDPFRSWSNRPWFWARLAGLPPELVGESDSLRSGGLGIDGLFGAMLDSRQIRKLPVAALLLLLVVYLAVIGPFDQWILRRTGRQMWTWITFPTWVILFSGLIYLIGYRLRAGDLEWNELQIVDQLPRPGGSALRGRTWASLYSPSNARYRLASDQAFATVRAEFQPGGLARQGAGRLSLIHPPRGVNAEAWVPVWVSQLYASDWLEQGPTLVTGTLQTNAATTTATLSLTNTSTLEFSQVRVAYAGRLHDLGPLPPNGRIERDLRQDPNAQPLDNTLATLPGAAFAVQQRRNAFGSEGAGQLPRDIDHVVLASFLELALHRSPNDPGEGFAPPQSFDLSRLHDQGEAVVFAWASGQGLAPALHRFAPVRQQRDTVLRAALRPSPAP